MESTLRKDEVFAWMKWIMNTTGFATTKVEVGSSFLEHYLRGVDATEGRGFCMDEVDHGFTTTKVKVTMKNKRGMVLAMI